MVEDSKELEIKVCSKGHGSLSTWHGQSCAEDFVTVLTILHGRSQD